MKRPRIFISHSEKNFGPTDFVIKIIDLIGCIPVIAETQPKLSRSVLSLVNDTIESCDAAIFIVTTEDDGSSGKMPSQGVLVEIGKIRDLDKFKGRYFLIKEESVNLGPMIPEARYKFNGTNYAPIAEAILLELSSMGLFRNYYELPGSDLELHKLMEVLDHLRDIRKKGYLKGDIFKTALEDIVRKTVEDLLVKVI